MRSRFGDCFNHDEDAEGYDEEVKHEEHPIRAGYRALLDWIGGRVGPGARVLDLGSAT